MTPRERNLADIQAIASRHRLTIEDVLGRERWGTFVKARHECIAMFRTRGMTTTEIGRVMQRDHSTIVHALQKMGWSDVDKNAGASAGLI